MKIAMIGHKRVPSREGGVEIVVENLAVLMAKKGHDVTVYDRRGQHVSGKAFNNESTEKCLEYRGIHVVTVPTIDRRGLAAISSAFFATMKAIRQSYDCIHYHAEGPSAMLIIPHLLGMHTVVTIHGLDWQRAKWGGFATKYLKLGEKIAAKNADEIIVLSRNVQKYFMDTYGRQTVYIPNGVCKPILQSAEQIVEKWGLKKDDYILFLGRIVPEKGVHHLVNAFHNVHTSKKLVIAGGSSDSSDYIEEIKTLVADDQRIILTDFVQGRSLEELFSNAYLYVLPSELEGMPISLLEAMSYGNCCVTSDIKECTEVVEDKAVTFQTNNETALADTLQKLCDNMLLTNQYKQMAAEYILKKYSWEDVTDKTLQLYAKVVSRRK